MKKLMVAFAAVAVAVSAHAVAYDWSASEICSGFYTASPEENAAGMAYLFSASAYDTVLAAVAAGTFDGTGAITGTPTAFNGEFSSDKFDHAEMAGEQVFGVLLADSVWGYESGELIKVLDEKYAYVTDLFTVPTTESYGNTHVNLGAQYDGTKTDAGWTVQSVPEPTSGLLLLLGVAGLALRRRRA